MRPPDFFIVGAPKCGTTAMSTYLAEHPEIFFSIPKEIHFFGKDVPGPRHVGNCTDYQALFAGHEDQVCGEGSVFYLYSRFAAQEIFRFNPDAKILIMLRDPVEFVRAAFTQHRFVLTEPEPDLCRALELEDERAARKTGWALLYTRMASYAGQVERYMEAFGPDQVQVTLLEDLKKDRCAVYRKTLQFLDVDPHFVPELNVVNASKQHRSRGFHSLARGLWRFSGLKHLVPRKLAFQLAQVFVRLNSRPKPRETVPLDVQEYIWSRVGEDVGALAKLIDRDLSHWGPRSAADERTGGTSATSDKDTPCRQTKS